MRTATVYSFDGEEEAPLTLARIDEIKSWVRRQIRTEEDEPLGKPFGRMVGGPFTADDVEAAEETVRILSARLERQIADLRAERVALAPRLDEMSDGAYGMLIENIEWQIGRMRRLMTEFADAFRGERRAA